MLISMDIQIRTKGNFFVRPNTPYLVPKQTALSLIKSLPLLFPHPEVDADFSTSGNLQISLTSRVILPAFKRALKPVGHMDICVCKYQRLHGLSTPRKFNYFELSFLFFPPPHSNPYLWKSKVTGFLLILRLELKVCGLFRSLESCYMMFSDIPYHVELASNSVPLSISIQTHAHTHTIQKAS